MKKKCRIYKGGGPYSYQDGGSNNFDLKTTQDSKKDDIPSQKVNNFMNWLSKTASDANKNKSGGNNPGKAQNGKSFTGMAIQDFYNQGVIAKPGSSEYDYGMKQDPNLQAHIDHLNSMGGDWKTGFQRLNDFIPKAQQGQFIPGSEEYWNGMPIDKAIQEGYLVESNGYLYEIREGHEDSSPKVDPKTDEVDSTPVVTMDSDPEFPNLSIDERADIYSQQDVFNPNPRTGESAEDVAMRKNNMKNMFKNAYNPLGDNPYARTNALISSMHMIGNIAHADERIAQERALRERVSNVHRLFAERGQDRGDYMVNLPGVGDPLKPDQHVRFGYNTKIAQDGMQVGDELNLTDSEIQELIKQGYDIEYL